MQNWLGSTAHHHWLQRHANDLLAFGHRTGMAGGGGAWLDDAGNPDPGQPLHTWITARMVHVYGLGVLLGVPGCAPIAAQAMAGLTGPLRDATNGGWHSSSADGVPAPGKSCYDHAFVMLAAATASHAGLDGAVELLDDATSIFLRHFWDDAAGRCVDAWDTSFSHLDPYRGINANMHAVEAMLSVAGLTGDVAWLERAERICSFVVAAARSNDWRIPEHYDATWTPQKAFNRDNPADQFKPYGATVGHAFEWARLLIHLANAPIGTEADKASLVVAAVALSDQAVVDGWEPDGAPGFVYTTDWDGTPVVRDRLHWVLAEAINTAAVLHLQTGEAKYAAWYRAWWDHAAHHHIDRSNGSWIHQLDHTNRPADSVWSGRPDLYHAFQACLIPTLPLYPMVAAAVDAAKWRPSRSFPPPG